MDSTSRLKIREHVSQINRCNQRGGRMLSIADLIEAGTLDGRMAAYFLAVLSKGKSFLVGAKPGGTGKTTVMAALLNLIPDVEIVPTEDGEVIEDCLTDYVRKCYVAHEIGKGSWYAYISGEDVRNFLELAKNHLVVSNLHADNIEEVLAHEGIDAENLAKIDLLVFMRVAGSSSFRRRIGAVYENRGGPNARDAFKLIFEWDKGKDIFKVMNKPALASEAEIQEAQKMIGEIIDRKLRTIDEVRTFILE